MDNTTNIDSFGFVQDDGGRAASGRKGDAGDCVTRAMSILTQPTSGLSVADNYDRCYKLLATAEGKATGVKSARNGISTKAYSKVFAAEGLAKVKLPAGARPTFAEAHERYGDCIVSTNGHIAALVGGALHDKSDCRTYFWMDEYGDEEERSRKARSVWVFGS